MRAASTRYANNAIAEKEEVRDLFDSLTDAIVSSVAPRTMRIAVDVAP